MFPAFIMLKTETHLHERTPLRTLRLADQMHRCFDRSPVGLARVALDARANNVFPRRRPAPIPRDHMVQIQILSIKYLPAILAGVSVPLENIVARELYFLFWQT